MTQSAITDVVVVGAGMAGLTLAITLARQGLSVIVLEKRNTDYLKGHMHEEVKPVLDGRASAIAYASQQALVSFGVWDVLAPYASAINDIHITDGNSPFFLHFDHKKVGDAPLGFMIENHAIQQVLFNELAAFPNITLMSPSYCSTLVQSAHKVALTLDSGQVLEARLVVAVDGKYSNIRDMLKINTTQWDYHQTAIVCTIAHEKDHAYTAQERFLPGGPFAILPLKGGKHSSLVWVEKTTLAPEFIKLGEEELTWHIQKRVGNDLGKVRLASPCFSYPLSVCFADAYYQGRTVLVGDAAHAIHPIAGQGFNLGIQDIASLIASIGINRSLGLDIGAQSVLTRYTQARRSENIAMIAITEGLTRLFSTNFLPVKKARRFGIGIVNQIAPLQRFFMRYAMGIRK